MPNGDHAFIMSKADSNKDDEPICFDQTTRHIGSIQKNMILNRNDSMNVASGHPWAQNNLAAKGGRMREDDEPNYSQYN